PHPHRQGLRHGRGMRRLLDGDAGAWRHGLCRGNGRRPVLARRAGDGDLRGHERHPGDGPRRPQDDGRGRGRLPGPRRDRGGGGGGAGVPARPRRCRLVRGRDAARGDGGDGRPCHAGPLRRRRALSQGLRPRPRRAFPPARGAGGRRDGPAQCAGAGPYRPAAAAIRGLPCRGEGRHRGALRPDLGGAGIVTGAAEDGIRYPFAEPPAPGGAIEVAEGVLWLRLPLPMALDHVNVFALDDGDGWTLVDTGLDTRKARAIWEAVLAGPLAGRPVRRVVVTHYHPDHVGLAGWFQARGAELVTTRTSWLFARMLTLDEHPLPAAETVDFWRRAGMTSDLLTRRAAERPFNFCDVVAPMPLGYTRIAEGSRLRAGGRDWIVRV